MAELSEVLLWLFIINLGTAFGAGVYEAQVVIPQWTTPAGGAGFRWNPEAARRADPGPKFWAVMTTLPLTLLTLASLFVAWYAVTPRREYWLGAAAAVLVERIATFAYFIPAMVRLQRATGSAGAVETAAWRWVTLNYVRTGIYLAAWVMALKALAFMR